MLRDYQNITLVALGTIVGHSLCTALAVLGGSWLASRISPKHITLGGAALFLLFGFVYLFESWEEYSAAGGEVMAAAAAAGGGGGGGWMPAVTPTPALAGAGAGAAAVVADEADRLAAVMPMLRR